LTVVHHLELNDNICCDRDVYYYIRADDDGAPDADLKNPGIWLAKLIPFDSKIGVRLVKRGDKVNRVFDERRRKWTSDPLTGKLKSYVCQVQWMTATFDPKENCLTYLPETTSYGPNGELLQSPIYYTTLMWETMLRTHCTSLANRCPPLQVFPLSYSYSTIYLYIRLNLQRSLQQFIRHGLLSNWRRRPLTWKTWSTPHTIPGSL